MCRLECVRRVWNVKNRPREQVMGFIPPKFESPSGGLIKPSEYLRSLRPDSSRRQRREAQVRADDDGEDEQEVEEEEAKYEEVEGGEEHYSEPVEPDPPTLPYSHGEPLMK